MSNKSGGSILAGFLAIFAGCGTMLRMCSKTDDIARLGKAASYADDTRSLRYLDDARNVRYGDDILNSSRGISRLNNTMSGEEFARAINESISSQQAVQSVDNMHEAYLLKNNSKLRKEIEIINNNAAIKNDPYQYAVNKENLIAKYTGDSYSYTRNRTFRTIKTAGKLTSNLFDYLSKINDVVDIYDILGQDSIANIRGLTLRLPEGCLVARDSAKTIWSDSISVSQVIALQEFDEREYLQQKTTPKNHNSSWTHNVKNFSCDRNKKSFRYKKGYLPIYGQYETITRDKHTILVESLSTDSLAPGVRIDEIIQNLIEL